MSELHLSLALPVQITPSISIPVESFKRNKTERTVRRRPATKFSPDFATQTQNKEYGGDLGGLSLSSVEW